MIKPVFTKKPCEHKTNYMVINYFHKGNKLNKYRSVYCRECDKELRRY